MTSSTSLSRSFTGLIRRAGMRSQVSAAIRLRAGAGLPVGAGPAPTAPLDENEELMWDDGSPNPEPCLDEVAPMVGKYEALGMLSAGMGFFAFLGYLAAWNDKASKIPWFLNARGIILAAATSAKTGLPLILLVSTHTTISE